MTVTLPPSCAWSTTGAVTAIISAIDLIFLGGDSEEGHLRGASVLRVEVGDEAAEGEEEEEVAFHVAMMGLKNEETPENGIWLVRVTWSVIFGFFSPFVVFVTVQKSSEMVRNQNLQLLNVFDY